MFGKKSILAAFVFLILLLPLVGPFWGGQSIAPFLVFPPMTEAVEHKPFSWLAFLLILLPSLAFLATVGVFAGRNPAASRMAVGESSYRFPWWGWCALVVLLPAWIFAWTRIPALAWVQRYSFVPLWFSYIVFVNALCLYRTGRCPLLHQRRDYLLLFPLSAVFWWLFEYLNQFVANWHYVGIDHTPLPYTIHATISFSTVLPAVYATHRWVSAMDIVENRFIGFPVLPKHWPRILNLLAFGLACSGLMVVGRWPEELFPLLWVAPLLLMCSLLHFSGRATIVSDTAVGDWRGVFSAAAAALVCGFFWEMWNYYSLAKWVYSIPYVERFHLFEMPILGYLGYLPFGVLCVVIADAFPEKGYLYQGGGAGMASGSQKIQPRQDDH